MFKRFHEMLVKIVFLIPFTITFILISIGVISVMIGYTIHRAIAKLHNWFLPKDSKWKRVEMPELTKVVKSAIKEHKEESE